MSVGGGGVVWNQLPTFHPESKSAKIQNSLCNQGGGGGGGGWRRRGGANFVRHLVRIWGELQNFDNKIFHQARASTSQRLRKRENQACEHSNMKKLTGIYSHLGYWKLDPTSPSASL